MNYDPRAPTRRLVDNMGTTTDMDLFKKWSKWTTPKPPWCITRFPSFDSQKIRQRIHEFRTTHISLGPKDSRKTLHPIILWGSSRLGLPAAGTTGFWDWAASVCSRTCPAPPISEGRDLPQMGNSPMRGLKISFHQGFWGWKSLGSSINVSKNSWATQLWLGSCQNLFPISIFTKNDHSSNLVSGRQPCYTI